MMALQAQGPRKAGDGEIALTCSVGVSLSHAIAAELGVGWMKVRLCRWWERIVEVGCSLLR
jgi:hypothetical protein